jgi:hypothetical protein
MRYGIELHEMRRRHLRHAGCRDELDVEAFVPEETFVAGDEDRQVMDGIHDRDLGFLLDAGLSGELLKRHGVPPGVSPRERGYCEGTTLPR